MYPLILIGDIASIAPPTHRQGIVATNVLPLTLAMRGALAGRVEVYSPAVVAWGSDRVTQVVTARR